MNSILGEICSDDEDEDLKEAIRMSMEDYNRYALGSSRLYSRASSSSETKLVAKCIKPKSTYSLTLNYILECMRDRHQGTLEEENAVDWARFKARSPLVILSDYLQLLFGNGIHDRKCSSFIEHWCQQGFVVNVNVAPFWGLKQVVSGPCGVLATVQCFMLRRLLFAGDITPLVERTYKEHVNEVALHVITEKFLNFCRSTYPEMTTENLYIPLLIDAFCKILHACAKSDKYTVALLNAQGRVLENPLLHILNSPTTKVYIFDDIEKVACYLVQNYELLKGEMGVVSLCVSALATRDKFQLKGDSDLDMQPFVGMYGHTTQELVNLLICGRAVTNLFDGNKELEYGPEGSLTLKGITCTGDVGFLTDMEALRYCQVGSFYKIPNLPLWVICSNGHYTSLFSLDKEAAKPSDLEAVRAAAESGWVQVDAHEYKFIQKSKVPQLLQALEFNDCAEEVYNFMGASEDILLWDNFFNWYVSKVCPHGVNNHEKDLLLFLYNGNDHQTPLTRINVSYNRKEQIQQPVHGVNGDIVGFSDAADNTLASIIWTRWPKTFVTATSV